MEITWEALKETFVAGGAVLGTLAFLRPVIETKHQKDQKLLKELVGTFSEGLMIDLEFYVYDARRIPKEVFMPLDSLSFRRGENHSSIRFTGPFSKYNRLAVDELIASYKAFRKYVQVPEWYPAESSDGSAGEWVFDKNVFFECGIGSYEAGTRDYAEHLTKASELAEKIKLSFQKLQITADLHLHEWPVAGILLKRRFKALSL